MQETENQAFIEESKRIYYKIGSIAFPAFGGQKVIFNYHGFYHLMYKQGKPRTPDDRMRRMRPFLDIYSF